MENYDEKRISEKLKVADKYTQQTEICALEVSHLLQSGETDGRQTDSQSWQ
jgi:hypothetical protein